MKSEKEAPGIQQMIEAINLRFTSGNSVPVTRASITVEEWRAIRHQLLNPTTKAT